MCMTHRHDDNIEGCCLEGLRELSRTLEVRQCSIARACSHVDANRVCFANLHTTTLSLALIVFAIRIFVSCAYVFIRIGADSSRTRVPVISHA